MRHYDQYCGLARGLDVIGDRWSLLVIRELALRDCRYSDIRDGVPRMATNLLAQRLRDLAAAGIVERYEAPKPVATALYRLTPRGREFLPSLYAVVRWARALMVDGPGPDDVARGRWTAFAALAFLRAVPADVAPLSVVLDVEGETLTLGVQAAGLQCEMGDSSEGDVRLSGSAWPVMGLLCGEISLADTAGLVHVEGSDEHVARLGRLLAANVAPVRSSP